MPNEDLEIGNEADEFECGFWVKSTQGKNRESKGVDV